MSLLLRTARRIRHAPLLARAEGLWLLLRPLYHRLLDPAGRGVPIRIDQRHRLRVPAALTGVIGGWESYEPECVAATVDWVCAHPDGVMLDLGCAIGLFTSLALQHGSGVRVLAVDADAASLACTRRFALRDAPRLSLLWGLLDHTQAQPCTLAAALARSELQLGSLASIAQPAATRFICLEDPSAAAIPHYSLDGLDAAHALPPGPLLVKCDVEGAELLVLQGADALLAARRPTLLLSVHPPALPQHGHSVVDVAAFLTARGYHWRLIARDHEEHWLAEPAP